MVYLALNVKWKYLKIIQIYSFTTFYCAFILKNILGYNSIVDVSPQYQFLATEIHNKLLSSILFHRFWKLSEESECFQSISNDFCMFRKWSLKKQKRRRNWESQSAEVLPILHFHRCLWARFVSNNTTIKPQKLVSFTQNSTSVLSSEFLTSFNRNETNKTLVWNTEVSYRLSLRIALNDGIVSSNKQPLTPIIHLLM